jgi:hypothetical protein
LLSSSDPVIRATLRLQRAGSSSDRRRLNERPGAIFASSWMSSSGTLPPITARYTDSGNSLRRAHLRESRDRNGLLNKGEVRPPRRKVGRVGRETSQAITATWHPRGVPKSTPKPTRPMAAAWRQIVPALPFMPVSSSAENRTKRLRLEAAATVRTCQFASVTTVERRVTGRDLQRTCLSRGEFIWRSVFKGYQRLWTAE